MNDSHQRSRLCTQPAQIKLSLSDPRREFIMNAERREREIEL